MPAARFAFPMSSGFNVAASIKMRKCKSITHFRMHYMALQCGRIYKDAEMSLGNLHPCASFILLQCGRIYKDAEIITEKTGRACESALQCGRIYKDAEMTKQTTHSSSSTTLQCGRIYKDAEINDNDT